MLKLYVMFVAISAAAMVLGRSFTAWYQMKRSRGNADRLSDVTSEVLARINFDLRPILMKKRVRVYYLATRKMTFVGAAFLSWGRRSILIEYEAGHLPQQEETFVIAHELGHIMNGDLLTKFFADCITVAFTIMVAVEFTTGGYFALPSVVAIPSILVFNMTLLIYYTWKITAFTECRADDYALQFVDAESAQSFMRYVKTLARGFTRKSIDRRLERIRRRSRAKQGGRIADSET